MSRIKELHQALLNKRKTEVQIILHEWKCNFNLIEWDIEEFERELEQKFIKKHGITQNNNFVAS